MHKIWGFIKTLGTVLLTRALPILTFAILFGIVSVQIDRWKVNEQPASDFVNYTAFDVQNARAGEDVYFKVCRDHKANYTYSGALTVYIYRDVDPKGTPTKVYAKDIGGSIRTECENKVLRASDFQHTPGTYKMAFCIDFNVKYNIQKTACKDSNIYKIYPQPTDLQQQLQYYQNQIDILNQQMTDRGVNSPNNLEDTQDSAGSNTAPPSRIGTPGQQQAAPDTPPVSSTDTAGDVSSDTTAPACAVNLGIGLFCGSDGLLRL